MGCHVKVTWGSPRWFIKLTNCHLVGGRWFQAGELGPPSAWTKSARGSHIHIYICNVQNFYIIDPKLINKTTKFILTPRSWPIPSVFPLDFHIKEKKMQKQVFIAKNKYNNNKGTRKKGESNLGSVPCIFPPFSHGWFPGSSISKRTPHRRARNCTLFPFFKCGKWSFFTFTSSAVPQKTFHSSQISFCIIKPISIRCLGLFSGINPESLPTSCE